MESRENLKAAYHHYELERIDKEIAVLEQQLEDLNESRREYINRNNLNRELKNEN